MRLGSNEVNCYAAAYNGQHVYLATRAPAINIFVFALYGPVLFFITLQNMENAYESLTVFNLDAQVFDKRLAKPHNQYSAEIFLKFLDKCMLMIHLQGVDLQTLRV
ncbi:hypothetical protein ACFE04_000704 [Oxalis oulophora]